MKKHNITHLIRATCKGKGFYLKHFQEGLEKEIENAKNTEGVYDYLIVCDERNNTPDIIDQNELVVDIYLNRYSNLYTYRETAFPSHLL